MVYKLLVKFIFGLLYSQTDTEISGLSNNVPNQIYEVITISGVSGVYEQIQFCINLIQLHEPKSNTESSKYQIHTLSLYLSGDDRQKNIFWCVYLFFSGFLYYTQCYNVYCIWRLEIFSLIFHSAHMQIIICK